MKSPLRDTDLVAFAALADGDDRTSVIVEAKRPAVAPPSALLRKTATSARELLPTPSAPKPRAAGGTGQALASRMGEIETLLRRLGLADCARRNDLSGSFVVEVTPEQLRELACAPSVQAIRCNREHRRAA